MSGKSLGFIEITGVVAAIDALDIMTKSANVSLVTWERKLGGRLVTIIVEGDIAAVNAAVENARNRCIKKPAAYLVIAAPHEETWRMVNISAQRLKKKEEAEAKAQQETTTKTKSSKK